MAVWDRVVEKMRALPPEKQQEVLDFVEFLERKAAPPRPLRSVRGLWGELDVDITAQDLDEAPRGMWGGFPRDDV